MDEALAALAMHLPTYRALYNADLVSVTRSGANWNIILSNPVPAEESRHIRLTT